MTSSVSEKDNLESAEVAGAEDVADFGWLAEIEGAGGRELGGLEGLSELEALAGCRGRAALLRSLASNSSLTLEELAGFQEFADLEGLAGLEELAEFEELCRMGCGLPPRTRARRQSRISRRTSPTVCSRWASLLAS